MYILTNGTEVTAAQVKAAFEAGQAVIVHGRGNGGSTTGLALDGQHLDTRGQCHSMWEETWTRSPANAHEALQAAYYNRAG